MTDEQKFKPWATWGEVPDEHKPQFLGEGPFLKPLQLASSDSLYDVMCKILAARVIQ